MDPIERAAATLLDRDQAIDVRLKAIDPLTDAKSARAAQVLLEVGSRTDEPRHLLAAVGSALASLSHAGLDIREFDMRDLTESAFDAYCAWMPPN